MDKLYLKNVEIFAKHGVFDEEKRLGQKFILSIEISLDTRSAAANEDLSKSIHYGELCNDIEEKFKEKSYDLIETAAEKIAEHILCNYSLAKEVCINLKKPWAPIGRHLDYAAVEIRRGWHKAYISIGSNIGDRTIYVQEAIEKLRDVQGITVNKISTLIETEPWGNTEQDKFINGAIEINTLLTPQELIESLLGIERDMKRERITKWGPRNIDLDIIFYDNIILSDEKCVIPHPRMEERLFVLEPLAEIAPFIVHPLLNKRVFRLLEDLKIK